MNNIQKINYFLDRAEENGIGIQFVPFENESEDRQDVLNVISERGWIVGKELRGEIMLHRNDEKTLNYLFRLKQKTHGTEAN